MLRLTVSTKEYLQIGENIRIVFLGGSKNHLRVMVEAPKELNVVRSKVVEKNAVSEEERARLPHYYTEPDFTKKHSQKKNVTNHKKKNLSE